MSPAPSQRRYRLQFGATGGNLEIVPCRRVVGVEKLEHWIGHFRFDPLAFGYGGPKPALDTAGFIPDHACAPWVWGIDVHLRPIEPASGVVVATANLHAAVAGAVAESLEFQPQDEIRVLPIADQPDVIVFGGGHRVGNNAAVFDFPECACAVCRFALNGPSGEVLAVEERLPRLWVSSVGGACNHAQCESDLRV